MARLPQLRRNQKKGSGKELVFNTKLTREKETGHDHIFESFYVLV